MRERHEHFQSRCKTNEKYQVNKSKTKEETNQHTRNDPLVSDNSLFPPFCNRSNAATSTPTAIVSVRTLKQRLVKQEELGLP